MKMKAVNTSQILKGHLMITALKLRLYPSHRSRPSLAVLLRGTLANWRSRHQLAALDDHLRDDIGVSALCAQREASRPIWDVPSHWLQ